MKFTKDYLATLQKGNLTKRIDYPNGEHEILDTYLFPLKDISLNLNNGRINIYISNYNNNQDNISLYEIQKLHPDEFNEIITNFIKESSDDGGTSFDKTKNDIKKRGQTVPGIVNEDGIVVDGNRRLACLIQLYNETHDDKFGYFLASCKPMDSSKMLEIEYGANFNVEGIKPYEELAILSLLYHLFTNSDSAENAKEKCINLMGISEKEFNKYHHLINIFADFFNWNKTPDAFLLIKQKNWLEPLKEIAKVDIDDITWHQNRDRIYSFFTINTNYKMSDFVNLLRSLKNGSTMHESFSKEYDAKIDPREVDEYKELNSKKDISELEEKRKNELQHALSKQMNDTIQFSNFQTNIHKNEVDSIQILDDVIRQLRRKITKQSITSLDEEGQEIFKKRIDEIKNLLNQLVNDLNNEEPSVIDND